MDTTAPLPEITYDDFAKLDLRVGLITAAEHVPKKDRLLKLTVDVGESSPRTIVAGIGQTYQPCELVGKSTLFLVNLAPRDFGKGLVSHGMILASGPDPKNLTILTVPPTHTPNLPPVNRTGARVG
jgi:methionyl-tRNA synthetase